MNIRLLTFLFCLLSFISNSQIENLLPILSDPHVLLDGEGQVVCTLPKNEYIINSLDGKHDRGWMEGMADIDIGTCGNIVTLNYETRKYSLYDTNGKLIRKFQKDYCGITPCSEGFYVACFLDNKSPYFSDKQYQFLDLKGDVIFSKEGYRKADAFVDGLAAVQTMSGKWAYLNDLGHELNLIPDTIKRITKVSSFYDGVSVITTYNERIGNTTTYKLYLLNRKGEIIFSSEEAFDGIPVNRTNRFYGGILSVELYKEDGLKNGSHMIFLNTSGDIVLEHKNQFAYRMPKAGYILTQSKTSKSSYNKHNLFDITGKEIQIPRIFESESKWLHQINDQYFQISYSSDTEGKRTTIFDASTGKNIYDLKDNVMAVKNDLISLLDMSTKRYYVVDKNTKQVVYDTDLKDQIVKDLEKNIDQADQIRAFVCTKLEDVNRITQLTELNELTIKIKDLKELPDLSGLTKLKILRLDDCRALKKFPSYLNSLTQLSLRNCTSATNVLEMVDAQTKLERLFLINFNIGKEDRRRLRLKYPETEIWGTTKNADSMLEMHVPGF